MAYELHIERGPFNERGESSGIGLEEWKQALAGMEGVRLCSTEPFKVTLKENGASLMMSHPDGDAEVLFAPGDWQPVFHWGGKNATFKAAFEPGDMSHPVWKAAVALASKLGASIRGDEGEVYDLETGEVVEG